MGYRGKLAERQQARQLRRRTGLPLAEIAARLGVSRSSVWLWVRDVLFEPRARPAWPPLCSPTPRSAARLRSTGWSRRAGTASAA